MKIKKYLVLLLSFVIAFSFIGTIHADDNDTVDSGFNSGSRGDGFGSNSRGDGFGSGSHSGGFGSSSSSDTNDTDNKESNENSSSNSGTVEWCTEFNLIWYIAGIILKVVYVLTPLVLIVTGAITFIQAMMKDKPDNIAKAGGLLVKKIVISLIIFLIVPISELCIGLVANEGWKTCADCFFNPSESCKGEITTGEKESEK